MRDQVLAFDTRFATDNDRPFATLFLAQNFHDAVNLGDNGRVFRLASFEDFCDARQTTGDVLGTGSFARRFGYQRPRGNEFSFGNF